jgi:hypothetical protein
VYVSQVENGRRIPSTQICVALANALELGPKKLIYIAQSVKEPAIAQYLPEDKGDELLSPRLHPSLQNLLNELEDAKLSNERLLMLVDAWSRILALTKIELINTK